LFPDDGKGVKVIKSVDELAQPGSWGRTRSASLPSAIVNADVPILLTTDPAASSSQQGVTT
jgi:hypothetical protein